MFRWSAACAVSQRVSRVSPAGIKKPTTGAGLVVQIRPTQWAMPVCSVSWSANSQALLGHWGAAMSSAWPDLIMTIMIRI